MTTFTVVLAVVHHGATVGTTRDDIEASSAQHAEELAIAAWRAVRPGRGFQPLLTLELRSQRLWGRSASRTPEY